MPNSRLQWCQGCGVVEAAPAEKARVRCGGGLSNPPEACAAQGGSEGPAPRRQLQAAALRCSAKLHHDVPAVSPASVPSPGRAARVGDSGENGPPFESSSQLVLFRHASVRFSLSPAQACAAEAPAPPAAATSVQAGVEVVAAHAE